MLAVRESTLPPASSVSDFCQGQIPVLCFPCSQSLFAPLRGRRLLLLLLHCHRKVCCPPWLRVTMATSFPRPSTAAVPRSQPDSWLFHQTLSSLSKKTVFAVLGVDSGGDAQERRKGREARWQRRAHVRQETESERTAGNRVRNFPVDFVLPVPKPQFPFWEPCGYC